MAAGIRIGSLLVLSAFLSNSVTGQNLGAFTDYRGFFNVFDNGEINQAESLPIKNYKVGGNCIAYVDNSGDFKIYNKGQVVSIGEVVPQKYKVTNDLVVCLNNQLLSVFDNGKITNLPGWATAGYVAGDSIIGYYDDNSGSYQIYHDGIAEPFPEILQDTSYSSFIAGDNILAYKGPGSRLEAYFHGVIYDLGTNEASSYKPGMNIVAFMDEFSQSFNVFYDGKITKLENLAPKSYRAGDNLVAYVDYSGNFKIFYKGDVTIIASTEQDFYSVVHNVVVFGTDNVNFSVFFKGENFLLETMLPIQHKEDYNSVGYIDAYGYLKLFSEGRTYEVSPFKLSKFVLTQNVLRYNLGLNDIHFFLNGKTY